MTVLPTFLVPFQSIRFPQRCKRSRLGTRLSGSANPAETPAGASLFSVADTSDSRPRSRFWLAPLARQRQVPLLAHRPRLADAADLAVRAGLRAVLRARRERERPLSDLPHQGRHPLTQRSADRRPALRVLQ